MSITPIKIITIVGVNNKLDSVINLCGKIGCFHPDDALSFFEDTENFTTLSLANPYADTLKHIKNLLDEAKKSVKTIDTRNFETNKATLDNYVSLLTYKLKPLLKEKEELIEQINKYKYQISELNHFIGMDLYLEEVFKCKYIKVRFGRIPKEMYNKLAEYEDNPYVVFFELTSDLTHYWGVYFAPMEHAKEVDEIFSGLYFERTRIQSFNKTPQEAIKIINEKILQIENKLTDVQKKIDELWKREEEECTKIYNKLVEYDVYYNIRKFGASYKKSFLLVGWIPENKQGEFIKAFKNIDGVDYQIDKPEEAPKHVPPTLLKNRGIFKPYEMFIKMYGVPAYGEIDPTKFVCITYFMMFGMMFGDIGHGLVLLIAGIVMWKLKGMDLAKIIIPCSITSMIWGVVFGSFFGFEHALDPFYKKFFNLDSKPIDVMRPEVTNIILIGTAAIGVVLITIVMVMNMYSSCKQRNFGNALFSPNGIAGLVFYSSVIIGILDMIVFSNTLFSNILFIIFLIILPLILMVFCEFLSEIFKGNKDWKPEGGFGGYIVQNIFEVFESVLSYLTNTVSFLRIGAYILVHSGMLLVVSTLSEMFAEGSVGYIIVIVLGNIVVIALEALLVGIQTLRLEFYEMFSRFYKGQGVPFNPVTALKGN